MPQPNNEGESIDSPISLPKRRIRPHKGNRSAVIFGNVRVTDEEKLLIQSAIKQSGLKAADWLVKMAKVTFERLEE